MAREVMRDLLRTVTLLFKKGGAADSAMFKY